ncbi:hypothetical protein GN244_ATG01227 [Phytophthora infestans]|uniref:Uncharacterized protein n=1 Tax=Phytophthora infestans TaxID=4787 RepID=A0A833SDG3_PHYIN|nr:hypothetical protein GN244_ATG01227 [Phytophthora infestans]
MASDIPAYPGSRMNLLSDSARDPPTLPKAAQLIAEREEQAQQRRKMLELRTTKVAKLNALLNLPENTVFDRSVLEKAQRVAAKRRQDAAPQLEGQGKRRKTGSRQAPAELARKKITLVWCPVRLVKSSLSSMKKMLKVLLRIATTRTTWAIVQWRYLQLLEPSLVLRVAVLTSLSMKTR